MTSTFHGIELSKRALFAQQAALNTTGHNVANANTEGYSRQRVNMKTAPPIEMPGLNRSTAPGQLGTGVDTGSIERMRDAFLDLQFRQENSLLGEWDVRQNTMDKLEAIFNEPSDTGLNIVLNDYWNAWQDLSREPDSMAARNVVTERGIALAETFNDLARQLTNLGEDLKTQLDTKVNEVNTLTAQIAELNQQIVRIEKLGQNPNDFMDRRDLLVDQLAKLVNIEVREDVNGGYQILISDAGGGQVLVSADGQTVNALGYNGGTSADDDQLLLDGNDITGFVTTGELYGYLMSRDAVKKYYDQLDKLVAGFADKVNATHNNGYDLNGNQPLDLTGGGNLFIDQDGNPLGIEHGAEKITFSATIALDPRLIAASSASPIGGKPVVGNGENALGIAQLRYSAEFEFPPSGGNKATISDFYNSLIGQLGVETQEAHRWVENHELLTSQTESLRQSVSGVSLDEEMANMMKFQHAYNAAARSMTVMDELLDKLINGTGIVGR